MNNLDLQLIKGGDVLWPLSGDDLDGEFHFNGDYYNNVERVIWSEAGGWTLLDKRQTHEGAGGAAVRARGDGSGDRGRRQDEGHLLTGGAAAAEAAAAAAAAASKAVTPPSPPPPPRATPIIGRGISTGYLSGCLVYLDSNGNGKLDAGEARYTTDKYGEFILPTENTGDVLVATSTSVAGSESCADAFTGIAPGLLTLAANGVSSRYRPRVVTALTTVADRMNRADSEARIKAALDIPDRD